MALISLPAQAVCFPSGRRKAKVYVRNITRRDALVNCALVGSETASDCSGPAVAVCKIGAGGGGGGRNG
jgi:hypothetical protein